MVSRCFHNRPFGRFTVFFLLAVALAVFTPEAPKARAATSGSGAWDFLVFGNYDMSTVDTGNISSSQSYNTALAATGQATSFANTFQNGYGAGLAIVYWFNDVLAFRVGAQGNFLKARVRRSTLAILFSPPLSLAGSKQSSMGIRTIFSTG